jgi:hypothetical protein
MAGFKLNLGPSPDTRLCPLLTILWRQTLKLVTCTFAVFFSLLSHAQDQIPQLVRGENGRVQLLVDGAPFLILGGQAHNSSASNVQDVERVYKALDLMHANTAEIPVSWNLLEPEPGRFDFTLIDGVIERARAHHLHLVLLWFGTTKNATLSYVPDWVKQDRKKYFRAHNAADQEISAISPFCTAALEADQRAFAALMKHIREFDGRDHTVILMQVENETGLLGTDRDYSSAAAQAFNARVPADLLSYIAKNKADLRPALQHAWQENGSQTEGTWTEIFGHLAPEAFSAWSISHYVDAVAAAGKTEYPIPYYVNVALMNSGAARAGEWPSGGGTANVIDIWKANAPHIDIIAPDIYRVEFPEMVEIYDRPDNPVLVPETGFAPYYAPYVFTTLAGHNGLGFAPFGVDSGYAEDAGDGYGNSVPSKAKEPEPSDAFAAFEENYRVLRPLLPLIVSKRYQNSLFPIVLNMYRHESLAIQVGDSLSAVVHFDETFVANTSAHRGGGIIIKLAADKFVIAGEGFHINFAELKGVPRNAEYLTIEEGTFEGDRWIRTRVLNGDEESVTLHTHKPRILLVHLIRRDR